ncbi:MAG: protein-L-isoaspartate(D-aspartate) O-methyltransferase [Bacteriovoracaceae bacterium]|nr:protein-L-isoaspartate(D-aspartate) O-methyltransferase [Bacteriovoracaceae bacterium]
MNKLLLILMIGIFVAGCHENSKAMDYKAMRKKMVETQIRSRGIVNTRVLRVMGNVPREKFVPEGYKPLAYEDGPLPIGEGQTISQPYIVAYMTEKLEPKTSDKVLEIGTGSGYQAAVLSKLVKEVYTIEIVAPLGEDAKKLLKRLGYKNIFVKIGDGYRGWKENAPYDLIILTAAPPRIPEPLLEQLAEGGRLLAPVGDISQELVLIRKTNGKFVRESLLPVRFVPMTGEIQKENN